MRSLRQSLPPLNAIAVFEAAARHLSFTRASAELNIAQSAVSRHVSNLEADLGVSLFVRNGNRLVLTASGQVLAEAIQIGLGRIRDSVEAIRRRNRQGATLTIACSYAMAHDWLMPRFGALRARLPNMQIRLMTADAYLDFEAEDVDLSIRYGNPRDWPDFRARKLLEEVVFPVCAPALLDQHPGLVEDLPEAWAEAPLLQLTQTSQGLVDWREWFRDLGATPSTHGPLFSTYTPMLQEALAGRGIVLGWKGIVDPYLETGQLVRPSARQLTSDHGFFIVHRPDAREDLIETVMDALIGPPPKAG
ncbi:LysR substrate-binding domain-containing protein [Sphingomonas colocasiae]|uniref:LysR family transcriptional regulator n=1 Tax=Sphingomonas colocasiae TaxID=1848973 RepID=A0ABS7PR26_9SPHN|nr:LysR substrate-binding domain-containing protein [Sphingomonas colocasiae]MBY8823701.1 LysR family transcriptional regulator [Sphingomonas colocasiae]